MANNCCSFLVGIRLDWLDWQGTQKEPNLNSDSCGLIWEVVADNGLCDSLSKVDKL